MLTGNGRHRRPRQAPALIVAAGVTGSAIAIPLLGAGSASAVESSTWDRVAECESGGGWSADTGNGYYGGLQLSQQTWDAFGGAEHASRPDLASRAQQIAVAEKVLAAQGAKAWAACAEIAGLTAGGGKSSEEAPSDERDARSTRSAQGAEGTPKRASKGSDAPAPAATQGVGSGGDRTAGGGKHRGEPADEPATTDRSAAPTGSGERSTSDGAPPQKPDTSGKSDTPAGSGGAEAPRESADGRPSRGDAPAREAGIGTEKTSGDTGAETEAAEGAEGAVADTSPGAYTVRAGDSLSAIAQERELDGGWNALYEQNRDTVGTDPDLIHPGQSLDLDAKQG
ncbi:LysM peptidoglycan-binding domain-containing protein [Streptomyces jumonjinensis]|uniref:LysM peptidoglycan-binding domain-containing protein n=1 Tax=Streptomyces jumonjinensis TaxID=1945 RepID=A0A646KFA0_STRJU|nr:LysM peptidoglycan-binding domain-containing protein [Streptomyces jumonjinensis]